MEGILLLLGSGLGEALGAGAVVADFARNVSWAVLVCVGLAIGTTVAKSQLPLIGLTGFLAAPTAFEVSRVVHKGVGEALSAPPDASTTSALLIAFIKALEYGFLGIAVGWLAERAWAGAVAYAAAGLVAGLIFGGTGPARRRHRDPGLQRDPVPGRMRPGPLRRRGRGQADEARRLGRRPL
jgi:hypothetical protein